MASSIPTCVKQEHAWWGAKLIPLVIVGIVLTTPRDAGIIDMELGNYQPIPAPYSTSKSATKRDHENFLSWNNLNDNSSFGIEFE